MGFAVTRLPHADVAESMVVSAAVLSQLHRRVRRSNPFVPQSASASWPKPFAMFGGEYQLVPLLEGQVGSWRAWARKPRVVQTSVDRKPSHSLFRSFDLPPVETDPGFITAVSIDVTI